MNGNFILHSKTKIKVCETRTDPIQSAVDILKRDMKKVLLPVGKGFPDNEIELQLDKRGETAQPETYRYSFSNGSDGRQKLFITGTDELGLIYGLLFISREYLHIPPFWFWNDFVPGTLEQAEIPAREITSPSFRVRYRGWFVNDEMLLLGWHTDPYDPEVWQPVFESLLRCGGNMVIPGTGENHLRLDETAAKMGLYLTQHHAEPLGAEMFSSVYPDQEVSYRKNPQLFEKLWEDAVVRQKNRKIIWALGFRGQGDRPFWEDDPFYATPQARGELIGSIIQKQHDIVCRSVADPVFCTYLYGEMTQLYQSGYLKLPEDVIKIWSDNGYGKMVSRRQLNVNPRVPALPQTGDVGPHGLYYHITFHDLQASNHLTQMPNSPSLIASELEKAFAARADSFLILNSGNIKPHTYGLDLVAQFWKYGTANVEKQAEHYVGTYYRTGRHEVVECYRSYFRSTIRYGSHEDEHAGEQFYHYPARIIVSHWMRGIGEQTEPQLIWATGPVAFSKQVEWFAEKYAEGVKSWKTAESLCQKTAEVLCESDEILFTDTLLLQSRLHKTGCEGGLAVCKSFSAFQRQDYLRAFLYACKAKEVFAKGYTAMKDAEHGHWANFYQNDCLTNVKMTLYFMDSLRRYLRIFGDGTELLDWERNYLLPERKKRVMLETTMTNQLTDDELYCRLGKTGLKKFS
jgi:hypothetical protein